MMNSLCRSYFRKPHWILCVVLSLTVSYSWFTWTDETAVPIPEPVPMGKVIEDVGRGWRKEVVEGLVKAMAGLLKASRISDGGQSGMVFLEISNELNGMLATLGHKASSVRKPVNQTKAVNTDMCQEKYVYRMMWQDSPYFYKGHQIENCTGVPKFSTLLTMVYNFVHYDEEDLKRIHLVMQEVNNVYPGVKIIAAVPSSSSITLKMFNDTLLFRMPPSATQMEVWDQLIAKVKTKYVYIGKNVIHFTWFDRLERLVREVNNLDAAVVASAFRTLYNGRWSMGCEQSRLRNYTLMYRQGYSKSMEECLKCDHVQGPFVAKRETFAKFPLDTKMTEVSGFAKWFLAIKKAEKNVVVCPDSMTFVYDNSRKPTTKADWLPLARSFQVEQVYPTETQLIEFSCEEADTSCSKVRAAGMALSLCCLRKLSRTFKFIYNECLKNGLMCQLAGETLLGAVKFNSVLPWQGDTGLTLHKDNYTAFAEKLKPKLTQLGYNWVSSVDVI